MMNSYYVYILASKKNSVLYIGMSNKLERRLSEHKNGQNDTFTKKYFVQKLVYFEETSDVEAAIRREKLLKGWNRAWKMNLIEKENPEWKDLSINVF
jgi:putative endonuclease